MMAHDVARSLNFSEHRWELISEGRAKEAIENQFMDLKIPLPFIDIQSQIEKSNLKLVSIFPCSVCEAETNDYLIKEYKHHLNTPWGLWRGGVRVEAKLSGDYVFSDLHRSYRANVEEAILFLCSMAESRT
ncbi:MAG: hypothetical protein K6L73_14595 [Cellvibrionaceae bacterium]